MAQLACASTVALAFTGSALAAYTPRFAVSHTPHNVSSAQTKIAITVPKDDQATFKVTFYVPLGYSGVLGQAAGTQIGTVDASILAKAVSANTPFPIKGVIKTDDPAKYTSVPASVGCAGGGLHSAVWLLQLEAAGRTLNVPAYIDTVNQGPEAGFAQFKVQICLPSPDVPEAAGGAALGAKLVGATLTMNSVFTTPVTAGQYVWPAVFTPYTAGSGVPQAAGTVQARAIVRLPGQVTLRAKYNAKRKRVTLSGAVTENRTGIGGARVTISSGATATKLKEGKTVTTGASGAFSVAMRAVRTTVYRVTVTVFERSIGAVGCNIAVTGLPAAPGGCVSSTASGFTLTSTVVTVKVKAKAK